MKTLFARRRQLENIQDGQNLNKQVRENRNLVGNDLQVKFGLLSEYSSLVSNG